jgi:hypothetical protein
VISVMRDDMACRWCRGSGKRDKMRGAVKDSGSGAVPGNVDMG